VKRQKTFPLVELAILFFAAWQAHDLPNAWQHSPHDRLGWLALIVWLAPSAFYLPGRRRAGCPANPFLLGAAILAGALSGLTELHFFGHVALALAVAAWFKISWRWLLWLTAAAAWMPVFGWWLADFSGTTIFALRLLLALAGAICLWPKNKIAETL
jgi:hypothetical protein